jgi:hypothetical protein
MQSSRKTLVTGLVAGFLALPGAAGALPYTFVNIADTSGPFSSFGHPALNASGTVAFFAGLDTGGSGIFTSSGGPTTTLYDSSGPFSGFGTGLALNASGTVAFFAALDVGGAGIFTGSGGPTATIADTNGPFSSFGEPNLNDLGTVAFIAGLDIGGFGIFTGPDPNLDAVIRDGDPLFGSTVNALGVINSPFLNNAGQLALFYGLDDGRMGIARADPLVAVSAPASLALIGVGVVAAGLTQRTSRRRRRARGGPASAAAGAGVPAAGAGDRAAVRAAPQGPE